MWLKLFEGGPCASMSAEALMATRVAINALTVCLLIGWLRLLAGLNLDVTALA
jgi:hypothetical protein